jgi:enamine deaminase RidA (YjgF/YER057c/UK114 family)
VERLRAARGYGCGVVRRIAAVGLATTPGYAHVAVAGRLVVTAGAVPIDEDGTLVGPGDHAAQARQVLANLEAQLAAAGAAPADVLKTTVYVVGPRESLSAVWEVVQDSPFAPAASTLLGVTVLGYEGQLVEVEAVALLRS